MWPVLNLFHLVKDGMPPLLNPNPSKKVEMVDAELLPLGEVGMGLILGNSVGVAIPQPRVAGEARYPGYQPHQS